MRAVAAARLAARPPVVRTLVRMLLPLRVPLRAPLLLRFSSTAGTVSAVVPAPSARRPRRPRAPRPLAEEESAAASSLPSLLDATLDSVVKIFTVVSA
jgi:hypothetical protein